MANIQIWNGSSTFKAGQTPFGFYDNDASFQSEADKVAKFCAIRLGYPLMDVELTSGSFYACFEEALTTYGNEVYQALAVQNYISLEGGDINNPLNEAVVTPSLQNIIMITSAYGTEAGVGGNVTLNKGSMPVIPNQQEYDLEQWAIDEGITGGIEIRKIYYEAPPAIMRYFDPYAGTGTGIQSLMDAFDFGSFSPGVNFLLMPASYDVLKTQAIEFNDQIRKSAFSFNIINNRLKIFPIPTHEKNLRIEYIKVSERNSVIPTSGSGAGNNLITDISNVPYENPTYTYINAPGRYWVFEYTLALAAESLAFIRGKYGSVPIPGAEVSLNQADLLTKSRDLQTALIEKLRLDLDESSRRSQLQRKAEENDYMQKTLGQVPLNIFIG